MSSANDDFGIRLRIINGDLTADQIQRIVQIAKEEIRGLKQEVQGLENIQVRAKTRIKHTRTTREEIEPGLTKEIREEIEILTPEQIREEQVKELRRQRKRSLARGRSLQGQVAKRELLKIIQEDINEIASKLRIEAPQITDKDIQEAVRKATTTRSTLRNRLTTQQMQQQEQRKKFTEFMMSAGSAGIGLLGAAGFPLLNVAFASMSGNVAGAGIAAATTAVGELARAISRLRESSLEAAKAVGAEGKTFRGAQNRLKSLETLQGVLQQASEIQNLEMWIQTYTKNQNIISKAMTAEANLSTATLSKFWNNPIRFINDMMTNPGKLGGEIGFGTGRLSSQAEQMQPKILKEAIEHMEMTMRQGMPGVGTDPYQELMRIQNATLDPIRQYERQWQEQTLDLLRRQLEKLDKLSNTQQVGQSITQMHGPVIDAQGNRVPPSTIPAMIEFFTNRMMNPIGF